MLGPPYTDGELPLNSDLRWWPIDRLFERLLARVHDTSHAPSDLETAMERLGSCNFLASDLKQAMQSPRVHDHVLCELEAALAQGHLRAMTRHPLLNKHELVPPARWAGKIGLDWSGGIVIRRRDTGEILYDGALYVWAPDVAALWPEVTVADGKKQVSKPAPIAKKTLTAKEQRKRQRDRRIARVKEWLMAQPDDLKKAEQRYWTDCEKKIRGLTKREYLQGLKATRTEKRRRK